ncbi:hypothetical protein ABIA30_004821 [Mycobacterium sp. MAA66]
MLARTFLAVQTATERDTEHRDANLIRLNINEFRRLIVARTPTPLLYHQYILEWSRWC